MIFVMIIAGESERKFAVFAANFSCLSVGFLGELALFFFFLFC